MPKLKAGTVFPTAEEDAAITMAAMADPDATPLTEAEWAGVKPKRGPGRPEGSGKKEAATIRYDRDLLEAFKGTGDGWQTRMNNALREWAKEHQLITS